MSPKFKKVPVPSPATEFALKQYHEYLEIFREPIKVAIHHKPQEFCACYNPNSSFNAEAREKGKEQLAKLERQQEASAKLRQRYEKIVEKKRTTSISGTFFLRPRQNTMETDKHRRHSFPPSKPTFKL